MDQLAKMPLPETKEEEVDDIFLLCRCCNDLTNFIRPFVKEVQENTLSRQAAPEGKTAGDQDQSKGDELQTELLKLWVKYLTAQTYVYYINLFRKLYKGGPEVQLTEHNCK